MTTDAMNTGFHLSPAPRVRALAGVEDAGFEGMLARTTRDAEITAAARALTAQALVAPILRELRANSNAWGPFAAGDAEKSFGPMLDLAIADRVAASPRLPVASMLEERLRAREQPAPTAAPAPAPAPTPAPAPGREPPAPSIEMRPRAAGRATEGWTG